MAIALTPAERAILADAASSLNKVLRGRRDTIKNAQLKMREQGFNSLSEAEQELVSLDRIECDLCHAANPY
jgi:hypothetical protein